MSSAGQPCDTIKFRCRCDKKHGKHEGKIYLKNRHVVFASNDESFTFRIPFELISGLKRSAAPVLLKITLHPGKYRSPQGSTEDSVIFDFTELDNARNKLTISLGRSAPGSASSGGGAVDTLSVMQAPRPASALAPPPRSLLVPPGVSDFSKGTSGEKDRDKLIEALSREIEPLIEKQSNREPTPQERMLRDKILRETYEAVVITGIMSEEEFWQHRHEAKLQEDINLQRRGVPSAKTDIKELTSDQQHIRYSVTKADEEQYFQQHPLLRQKYDAEVPALMSKQQFWTAFLEFSVIRQHPNLKTSTHYNKFDKFEIKDSAEAKRRFEEACSKNADSSVAITHDALDIYHGIYENSVSHCHQEKEKSSKEKMHKINRDSVSVMLSLKVADAEPSSKRTRLVERQVLECLEMGGPAPDAPASLYSAEGCRELVFPPISISGRESVVLTALQPGQRFNILNWMNSSKDEHRVHAALESDLKSLISVQFEVISSFWLNFPPSIDDIAAVKRCFRLSKALRDQWDKLIAFASKSPFEVDLGLLHRRVSELGLSCVEECSCRFAMVFYRQFLCINRAMCSFKNWSDQAPENLRQAIMK